MKTMRPKDKKEKRRTKETFSLYNEYNWEDLYLPCGLDKLLVEVVYNYILRSP